MQKQQVVFMGRKLWGGGAEKIMYYLSHSLDPNIFEPHVVYMLNQQNVLENYDSNIPLYCLETINQPNQGSETYPISQQSRKLITRLLSGFRPAIKQKFKNRLNLWIAKAQNFINPVPVYSPFIQEVLVDLRTISESLSPPMVYASGLRRVLATLHEDAILIAMQEEPAVQAWINNIYHHNHYLVYLCAPESIHIPLIYPNPDRCEVEKWLFGNACRTAKVVTVPNSWMLSDLVQNFEIDASRVNTIPNPIDCKLVIKKSEEFLPDVSLHDGKTIFVQLARIDPQKNHRLTIEACDILRKTYSNFVVLVIGDGSERPTIEKLIAEKNLQDKVILLGELSNPYPYLKISRASLMTSNFEASPLALVDALLLGAVPISTDCIAGPSDTLGEGKYGMLISPGQAQELADAMWKIAVDNDLHHRLKSEGMKYAWEYDMPLFVDKWSGLILDNR